MVGIVGEIKFNYEEIMFESIQVGDGIQQSGYGDFDSDGLCHGWWNWDRFDQNTQSVERMSVLYDHGKQKEARFDLDVSKKNWSTYFIGKKVIDDHQTISEVGFPVKLGLWRGYTTGRLCYVEMHYGYLPVKSELCNWKFKFENEKWYFRQSFLNENNGQPLWETVECEESDLPPENCWDDNWNPSKKLQESANNSWGNTMFTKPEEDEEEISLSLFPSFPVSKPTP
jgi:hypothetical protein